MLVLCGYAFILLIDKVVIDAHGAEGHGHDQGKHKKHVKHEVTENNPPVDGKVNNSIQDTD